MINSASVVIGGGNWGIKEADVLGYKLINSEYYARDIDFANSTAAGTYTDSTGVVRKSPYNLLQYSEQFDNVAWGKLGSPAPVVTANDTISPSGLQDADSLVMLSPSVATRLNQSVSFVNSTYVFSVYVKSLSGTNNTIRLVKFDGTSETFSSDITVTTEWTRVSYTFSAVFGSGNINIRAGASTSNVNIAIWGAQLVEGTEALPYFPTTTRLNVPRIDYRNADGSLSTTGRLLLEPQRTNSLTRTTDFSSGWTFMQTTLGASSTGPGGANTAFRITNNSSVADPYFEQSVTPSANTWCWSIYVKQGTASEAWIYPVHVGLGGDTSYARFNFATKTFTNLGIINSSGYQDLGNGLFRIWCTVNITSAVTSLRGRFSNGTTANVYNDWAYPQLEVGSYPTTYIPTTTATVTRNADSASRTGVSSWIGQTEGTLFMEVNFSNDESGLRFFSINDGTSSNRMTLNKTTNRVVQFVTVVSGFSLTTLNTTTLPLGVNKIAFAYANNDYSFYVNGVLVGTRLSGGVPACNRIDLGNELSSFIFNDRISQAALFQTRLTNEQLQSLTTL